VRVRFLDLVKLSADTREVTTYICAPETEIIKLNFYVITFLDVFVSSSVRFSLIWHKLDSNRRKL